MQSCSNPISQLDIYYQSNSDTVATMDSRIGARTFAGMLGGWRTREPAYEALADSIRILCLDNRIAAHTALPAERELAAALSVSRTTVAGAYRSLRDTGHIASLRGSGSVTTARPSRDIGGAAATTGAIDLQQASPAAWPGLAGIIAEAAADAARIVARSGYDIRGAIELREAIADRYSARGIPTDPSQIVVTTGAQSAIHLLSTVLVGRGDRVVIETPTYPHAAEAIRAAGARLVAVPVTIGGGWDLDRAAQVFTRTQPRMAYLMPRFQNPTGRSMTDEEEAAFAHAARASRSTLVIDETTADLTIDVPAASPAFGRDAVVRVGSLGKIVWGGLRIGWIRADGELVQRIVAARPARELGTPDFEQAVAARLFSHLPEILTQRSLLLRSGRDALVDALTRRLPEWRIPQVHGGVALWVELDAPLSTGLVLAARAHGVSLSSGSRFGVDGTHDRHLRLPFTAPPEELRRAVDTLADAWPSVRAAAPVHGGEILDAVV